MTWFSDLVERAGFGSQWRPIAAAMALAAALVYALIELVTSITGLALAGSVLIVAFALELLRLVASRRQLALTQSWPAVMDSLRSGAQAGMGTFEQIEDLGCVHATILLVVTTHCEWACHGSKPILVVIDNLEIDYKVHSHVGKLWVLFPQMPPCLEMTIQLVIALMQYEETKLGIIA